MPLKRNGLAAGGAGAFAALLAWVAGCGSTTVSEPPTGGDAGADAVDVDRGMPFDAAVEHLPPIAPDCPARAGMVGVRLGGGACFLIDAHQVSRADYRDAVAGGTLQSSAPECAGNPAAGEPRLDPTGSSGFACGNPPVECTEIQCPPDMYRMHWPPRSGEGGLPMACVDWCDAAAYCESAGKRLCTSGEAGAGPLADVDADEWYAACSGGGSRTYSYGDVEDPHCDPAAGAECEGAYAGLWGMSGSGQLTATCGAGVTGRCTIRGGACSAASTIDSRASFGSHLGFRCCADP